MRARSSLSVLPILPFSAILAAFQLIGASPSAAAESMPSRNCRVLAILESPEPRVRCEDTGQEFFFADSPTRLTEGNSWRCSTAIARLSADSTDVNGYDLIRTVSVETNAERDRRTQEEDLLRIAEGGSSACWRREEVVIDNPRARARAEAEARRVEEEQRQNERLHRILDPHRRTPKDPAEALIRATTPYSVVPDPHSPRKLDLCIAVDRSSSMASTFAALRKRFSLLEDAWSHHFPDGIRVSVIGFGQTTPYLPYIEQLLLDSGSPSQLRSLLSKPIHYSNASIEPVIDAVWACNDRLDRMTVPGDAARREIVILSDEAGSRLLTSPQPQWLMHKLRAKGTLLAWVNPREWSCPEVLSTEIPSAQLESRYKQIMASQRLLMACTSSAAAYMVWNAASIEKAAWEIASALLAIAPEILWERSSAKVQETAWALSDLYPQAVLYRHQGAENDLREQLARHADYLKHRIEQGAPLQDSVKSFALWAESLTTSTVVRTSL